jgi:hypothetical protein
MVKSGMRNGAILFFATAGSSARHNTHRYRRVRRVSEEQMKNETSFEMGL